MSKKDLEKLISEKDSYDKPSQDIISNIVFARNELDKLNSMKRTEGWKVLERKIREELQNRIEELVKDDLKVQTLLALLKVSDTKTQSKILEQEIEKILPES